jgi:hypothetical protein
LMLLDALTGCFKLQFARVVTRGIILRSSVI